MESPNNLFETTENPSKKTQKKTSKRGDFPQKTFLIF